jgi:hypothetical protein
MPPGAWATEFEVVILITAAGNREENTEIRRRGGLDGLISQNR